MGTGEIRDIDGQRLIMNGTELPLMANGERHHSGNAKQGTRVGANLGELVGMYCVC